MDNKNVYDKRSGPDWRCGLKAWSDDYGFATADFSKLTRFLLKDLVDFKNTLVHVVQLKTRRPRQQLPQNIRQNPAMQVVINLNRSIDSENERHLFS